MRGVAGVIGGLLTLALVSTLFLDLPSSDQFLTISCIVGSFGLPGILAWYDVRAERKRPFAWRILQSLLGTILGATVAHLLLGYSVSMAARGGLGYGAALSLITVPSASLLLFAVLGPRSTPLAEEERADAFWVFAYGSLMVGGWEGDFGGVREGQGVLRGYRRSFNKSSTRNWGTSTSPCPTLGLEEDASTRCVGVVFSFPETSREGVVQYLTKREGPSFDLLEKPVSLNDGIDVPALVAVNRVDAPTYIGEVGINGRAAMVRDAAGADGTCEEYLRRVHKTLHKLSVKDEQVDELVAKVWPNRPVEQRGEVAELTWTRVAKIWWSLVWRQTLFGTLAGASVAALLAFVGSAIGLARPTLIRLAFWAGLVIAFPVALWVVRWVLTITWSDFRIILARHDRQDA